MKLRYTKINLLYYKSEFLKHFMNDSDRVESQLYGGHKVVKLLRKLTELCQFRTLGDKM